MPFIDTRPKMFAFLRNYSIIQGKLPKPELVSKGLFTVEHRLIKPVNKTVPVIRVSKRGERFIKDLAKLVYK
jgi:hypothetical protein